MILFLDMNYNNQVNYNNFSEPPLEQIVTIKIKDSKSQGWSKSNVIHRTRQNVRFRAGLTSLFDKILQSLVNEVLNISPRIEIP